MVKLRDRDIRNSQLLARPHIFRSFAHEVNRFRVPRLVRVEKVQTIRRAAVVQERRKEEDTSVRIFSNDVFGGARGIVEPEGVEVEDTFHLLGVLLEQLFRNTYVGSG